MVSLARYAENLFVQMGILTTTTWVRGMPLRTSFILIMLALLLGVGLPPTAWAEDRAKSRSERQLAAERDRKMSQLRNAAKYAYNKQDYDAAAAVFSNLVSQHPKPRGLAYAHDVTFLVAALKRSGKSDEALNHAQSLYDELPSLAAYDLRSYPAAQAYFTLDGHLTRLLTDLLRDRNRPFDALTLLRSEARSSRLSKLAPKFFISLFALPTEIDVALRGYYLMRNLRLFPGAVSPGSLFLSTVASKPGAINDTRALHLLLSKLDIGTHRVLRESDLTCFECKKALGQIDELIAKRKPSWNVISYAQELRARHLLVEKKYRLAQSAYLKLLREIDHRLLEVQEPVARKSLIWQSIRIKSWLAETLMDLDQPELAEAQIDGAFKESVTLLKSLDRKLEFQLGILVDLISSGYPVLKALGRHEDILKINKGLGTLIDGLVATDSQTAFELLLAAAEAQLRTGQLGDAAETLDNVRKNTTDLNRRAKHRITRTILEAELADRREGPAKAFDVLNRCLLSAGCFPVADRIEDWRLSAVMRLKFVDYATRKPSAVPVDGNVPSGHWSNNYNLDGFLSFAIEGLRAVRKVGGQNRPTASGSLGDMLELALNIRTRQQWWRSRRNMIWAASSQENYDKMVVNGGRFDYPEHAQLREGFNTAFSAAQEISNGVASSALTQMAARFAAANPKLAHLVREQQDLLREQGVLNARLMRAAALPVNQRPLDIKSAEARLAQTGDRLGQINDILARMFPRYVSLTKSSTLSVEAVRKRLKPSEALIQFQVTSQETFVWVVTQTNSRWLRNKITVREIKDHVDALRCGLDYGDTWRGSRCFNLLNKVYSEQDYYGAKPLPFDLTRAYTLYRELFGGTEDLIQGKKLLIVPSGALTQLPFQALVTQQPTDVTLTRSGFSNTAWLARKHAVTILPSVSSLNALRSHARNSTAAKPFAGFGNPLLDGDSSNEWHRAAAEHARSIEGCAERQSLRTASLRAARAPVTPLGRGARLADLDHVRFQTPLPETADELCAVARSAGANSGDIYLGSDNTEAAIKDMSDSGRLAGYRVLHFATHGALAGELQGSNEPGLILTPQLNATTRDDGYLSASEIARLKLDADWVILSACNTAAGDSQNAEALSGLARAFFYAGARSLLVSHWYVDSHATVSLITEAFELLKRDPSIGRSGALRSAMLSLIDNSDRNWHPAYWAPFVVVGEGN